LDEEAAASAEGQDQQSDPTDPNRQVQKADDVEYLK
jgi:hypothetical protein